MQGWGRPGVILEDVHKAVRGNGPEEELHLVHHALGQPRDPAAQREHNERLPGGGAGLPSAWCTIEHKRSSMPRRRVI